jgi:hypothetical protein
VTIEETILDPQLFARWFPGNTWSRWRTFLRVLFALPLDKEDLQTFSKFTGRQLAPTLPFSEGWLVVGRRGGKSLIVSLIAVYLAFFRDYSRYLQRGEFGTIAVIAADRKQARTVLRYIKAFLELPLLKSKIVSQSADSITLENRIVIEVHTASWRSIRGYTLLACIADEIAFWRSEDQYANPDKEIIAACRPGLSTIPNSLLLCISSPYARRGILWDVYARHFAKDSSDILVWQATSRDMNPTLRQSVIDRAMEEDESSAKAEYEAEFRKDIESFIDSQLVKSLAIPGRLELPPLKGVHYRAFCDPAGGSGQDSFTLAIAHQERQLLVLDCIREQRPPFSPELTTQEFAATLKSYRLRGVVGDHYAGSWPSEAFSKNGVQFVPAAKTKSEIYKECLPLLNSRRVELLDSGRLLSQLSGLERRTRSGGNDLIDHSPNAHDDVINAAAGALLLASRNPGPRNRIW